MKMARGVLHVSEEHCAIFAQNVPFLRDFGLVRDKCEKDDVIEFFLHRVLFWFCCCLTKTAHRNGLPSELTVVKTRTLI